MWIPMMGYCVVLNDFKYNVLSFETAQYDYGTVGFHVQTLRNHPEFFTHWMPYGFINGLAGDGITWSSQTVTRRISPTHTAVQLHHMLFDPVHGNCNCSQA
eukprot:s1400_g2.t1